MAQNSSGESAFPISYDCCPGCGCKDTVESKAVEEEVAAGRLPQTAVPAYNTNVTLLTSPAIPQIIGAPMRGLVKKTAYCWRCGMCYCVGAKLKEFPVDPKTGAVRIDAT